MKLVAYYRVSTKRQGDSGYGLDAQRASVARFVASNGAIVVAEFTEVESGTKDDRKRPQLGAAIERCRLTGASLVVAKLDRLARNAGFVHRLRDSGVDFVCCDMPSANKLTIGILAEVAEAEGETIRRRTKEGIAQARAKGVRWGTGGKNTTPEHLARMVESSRAARAETRDARLRELLPLVRSIRANKGGSSLSHEATAARLNAMHVQPLSGKGVWNRLKVLHVLKQRLPEERIFDV
jgi:DNA invertase Pin-like site-specific DNA recombinase